jgi:hypothetical protein
MEMAGLQTLLPLSARRTRVLAIAASTALLVATAAVPTDAKGAGQGGGARAGAGQASTGQASTGQASTGRGAGPGAAGVQTERPACGMPDRRMPLDAKCGPSPR